MLLKPRTENEDKTKPAKKQKKNGKSQDEGQLDCVDEEMLTVEDMGVIDFFFIRLSSLIFMILNNC